MADDSRPVLQLAMPATISGFELARLQVRRFLANRGVDELTVSAVELVVEECVTNTLRYGYDHDTGLRWIELGFTVADASIELVIEDDAHAFDPLSVPPPSLPPSLDGTAIGGMGLVMVRRSTRALNYLRINGRNRLCASIPRSA